MGQSRPEHNPAPGLSAVPPPSAVPPATGRLLNRVGQLQLAAKLGHLDRTMYLRALDVLAVVLRDTDPDSALHRYAVAALHHPVRPPLPWAGPQVRG